MIRYPDGSIRYFTVFEAKRIQTFPDDYVITGAWGEALRQIGNAVPVRLAEHLGKAAMKLLKGEDKTVGQSDAMLPTPRKIRSKIKAQNTDVSLFA